MEEFIIITQYLRLLACEINLHTTTPIAIQFGKQDNLSTKWSLGASNLTESVSAI